jgi:hypothetical protein
MLRKKGFRVRVAATKIDVVGTAIDGDGGLRAVHGDVSIGPTWGAGRCALERGRYSASRERERGVREGR